MFDRHLQHYRRLTLVGVLGLLLQGCLPNGAGKNGTITPAIAPRSTSAVDSVSAFTSTLRPVLQTNCANCHGAVQQPLFAQSSIPNSHSALRQNDHLVNLASPESSRIVVKIRGGHNGFNAALADTIVTQIEAWAAMLESEATPDPAAEEQVLATNYQTMIYDRYQLASLLRNIFGSGADTLGVNKLLEDPVNFGRPCSLYEVYSNGPRHRNCSVATPQFELAKNHPYETATRQALLAETCERLTVSKGTLRYALAKITTTGIPPATPANIKSAVKLFYRFKPEPQPALIQSLQNYFADSQASEDEWARALNAICVSSYWQVF